MNIFFIFLLDCIRSDWLFSNLKVTLTSLRDRHGPEAKCPLPGRRAMAAEVLSTLGPRPETGALAERQMLQEMGDWHDHISELLDTKAQPRGDEAHIEEIAVGELPARVAGWCQDVGSEAASSLAKTASSLLPRSTTVDWQARRKSSEGVPRVAPPQRAKAQQKKSWLVSTVSSTLSLLSMSPSKTNPVGPNKKSTSRVPGERVRGTTSNGALRRERSDLAERPKSDRDVYPPTRRTVSEFDLPT